MKASGRPVCMSMRTMKPQLRLSNRGERSPCALGFVLRALPPMRIAAVSYDGVVPMWMLEPYTTSASVVGLM